MLNRTRLVGFLLAPGACYKHLVGLYKSAEDIYLAGSCWKVQFLRLAVVGISRKHAINQMFAHTFMNWVSHSLLIFLGSRIVEMCLEVVRVGAFVVMFHGC